MKTLKSILAALAMTAAATAGAQTLKMEPQVSGVTAYETTTVVNLVVVKPEIKLLPTTASTVTFTVLLVTDFL